MTARRWTAAMLAALSLACATQAGAQAPAGADLPERKAFKVCQDPNNLPFSSAAGEGYENKIAELMARDLNLPLTYFGFPNRMNFIRNTLKFKLPDDDYPCDIVMGVPAGFDQVSATKPYYRSTYVLVFPQGKGLDGIKSSDDFLALPHDKLSKLRIGLYDKSPAAMWMVHHDLVDQGVPYSIMNADPGQYPGEVIEHDLESGKIDVAILWGPLAGFFVRRPHTPQLMDVPMKSEPGAPFEYSMAVGVRYGEPAWKQQVEGLLAKHQAEIQGILRDYGVPLVPEPAQAAQ